jgi:hypothetical protein
MEAWSYKAWAAEVERDYGWFAYTRDSLPLRATRRVLLLWPVGRVIWAVCSVIEARRS